MNLSLLRNIERKLIMSKLGNQLSDSKMLNSGWIFPFAINLKE